VSLDDVDIAGPLKAAGFGIKGLKSWQGREGRGSEASLTRHARVVGRGLDEANGGDAHLYWTDDSARVAFEAAVAGLPLFPVEHSPEGLRIDEGWAFGALCDDFEMTRTLKRKAKTHTIFRVDGKIYTLNVPGSEASRAGVLKRHPTAVFFNDKEWK
jgi:hypothetical protein